MKSIQVSYFASLRDRRGVAEETLETEADTARDLYQELSRTYEFVLICEQLMVAINDRVAAWDDPLNDGDHLVFLTPFGGGRCSL